ncbi:MAG: TonB-dependent receptor [Cytophagaceae bacterium]|jgi:outer membrane cobalamin receptor|nr:TonB-dependent receptor [Cytophagaceae bacterium]
MFKIIIYTLVGIAMAAMLPAQNVAPDTTKVYEIKEVVVSAYRYREVVPAQRLSGKRLEALSSFSVADAVRYFSGVQIKDYGGIGGLKTVDIRSMGSHHLGVFYDGIEIGNAQNGTVDLGKFSLDFIEEVSVYNGHKSEIFQSAKDFGSAGAIYLRTRRPRFKGAKKTNVVTYFRTGSFNLVNPSVLWEQKVSENVSSSLNAEYVYSSGKYRYRYTRYNANGSIASDTTAIRQNGDIHSLRIEGGFNGYVEQGCWNVKGYFYDSEKGLPGAIVDNVWKNAQRQWDRNMFVQGNFQKYLYDNYDFLLNAKYSNDYMRYHNPDTTLMYIDNRFWQHEIYISTANKYSILHNWDVNLSVDYIWNALDANLSNFASPTRNSVLAALATAFEWRRLKAQASVLGTFVYDNVNIGKANDKSEYTPAVFLSYQPFVRMRLIVPLRIRAFYKNNFRMPTFNDLYYTDVGNSNLLPELAKQYNVGAQYEIRQDDNIVNYLNFSADAYYNEINNKIVAVPKGGSGGGSLYRWMMMNLGYVEIRGVDVSAKIGTRVGAKNLSPMQINVSLNYTFQKAQDFTDAKSKWYGGQIAYVPQHSGSAIVNTVWKTWDVNYSFIYVGERYHNSANIAVNREQPWYTHDLTVGKTQHIPLMTGGKLKIAAEVNNLFNQAYEVIHCYPMPGRNFKIVLKLEI